MFQFHARMSYRVSYLLLALSCLSFVAAEDSPRVKEWDVYEVELSATGPYQNPYAELTAEVSFTPPSGEPARAIPMFWDGGSNWKFRFSPDWPGTWQWKVTSSDPGLAGKSGQCVVVGKLGQDDGVRHGGIRPMKGFSSHFERQDGTPFWFAGDTAWALYYDRAEEKYDRQAALAYLDARAAQGFNVVHSSLLSELGWGNSGGMPFEDINAEKLNPGYWQEVDVRLAHANAKGLVCGLALAWGDKRKIEPFAWRRFPGVDARKRYARFIAARYSAFDTYFLVSGEWHGEIHTRLSTEEAVKREFIEIGETFAAADPHDRMIGIHPMTNEGSVREFVGTKWMSFGDYQQNYRELHGRILASRSTQLPVVNSEYGYLLRDQSGDGVPDKDNSTSLASMRHATWDIVMAGGYFVTGFGTTYLGGGRDPGPFDLKAAKNKPWEEQIAHMKKVFSDTQWWKLQPHDELLSCQTPRGKDTKEFQQIAPPAVTYWCLAEPDKQYIVYFRGLSTPLTLSLGNDFESLSILRMNPRTGERTKLAPLDKGELMILPPDNEDWVVLIIGSASGR